MLPNLKSRALWQPGIVCLAALCGLVVTRGRYHEVAASAMRHCEALLQEVAGVSASADAVYSGRASGTVVAVGHGASPVFVAAGQHGSSSSSGGAETGADSAPTATNPLGWASRRRVALTIDFVVGEVRGHRRPE